MIQMKRNSARFGGPAALLVFACALAGCESSPPDLTDEPPIADSAPEVPVAIHPVALRPAPEKAPRLLNAAIEMQTLSAPPSFPAPEVASRPRQPAAPNDPKPVETASLGATPAPRKKATLPPPRPFEWPVEGKLISGFGTGGDGERNDGINIAADPGTPIHAAAAGTVTYASRLKGYGNLVLIQHENGYITAYAHAQSLLVAPGDRVDRGDVIGLSGKSGDVATPQLHFEIREGTKAINPRPLLLSSRES
jgi:murein DD-endopeptidase MepM/ murein hydrolase activator NlpD